MRHIYPGEKEALFSCTQSAATAPARTPGGSDPEIDHTLSIYFIHLLSKRRLIYNRQ